MNGSEGRDTGGGASRFDKPLPPTAESPCIKVCVLDIENHCRGCGRTIDEIQRWSAMTTAERIAVNQRIGFVSHE